MINSLRFELDNLDAVYLDVGVNKIEINCGTRQDQAKTRPDQTVTTKIIDTRYEAY